MQVPEKFWQAPEESWQAQADERPGFANRRPPLLLVVFGEELVALIGGTPVGGGSDISGRTISFLGVAGSKSQEVECCRAGPSTIPL